MAKKEAAHPANYKDPEPDFTKMGWGKKELQLFQNLIIENAHQESLPNIVTAQEAEPAGKMIPEIEVILRKKMLFDEGWNLMVAENIVCKLADGKTIMVRQNIGNCVGDSHACLIVNRSCHEILALGDAEEPLGEGNLAVPFIPYTYGVGRWAGNMLGPGDGSYCGAQIKGTMTHGFLPCFVEGLSKYAGAGDAALPQGTAAAGRLFGKSKAEIQKWTDKASDFDLLEAPKCTSGDDAIELVAKKQIPLQICSGQGFAYDRFDAKYGVHLYRFSGSWSHSMQIVAVFAIKGQWFVVIRNQWGQSASKGSPEIGIPAGCMVITLELFAKWVKKSECIGLGSIKGLGSNPGA